MTSDECEEKLGDAAIATFGEDLTGLVPTLRDLAHSYKQSGHYAEAERFYRRVVDILSRSQGIDDEETARAISNLADVCQAQARYEEAGELYHRALASLEQSEGSVSSAAVAKVLRSLGALYTTQGKHVEANTILRRSIETIEVLTQAPNPDWESDALVTIHRQHHDSLSALADLRRLQGRYSEAETLQEQVLEAVSNATEDNREERFRALNGMGMIQRCLSNFDGAEECYQKALVVLEPIGVPDDLRLASLLRNFAELYHSQNRFVEAESFARRSIEIHERKLGPDHPDVAHDLQCIAISLIGQERYDEAEQSLQRTCAIMENTFGNDHPSVVAARDNLTSVHHNMG